MVLSTGERRLSVCPYFSVMSSSFLDGLCDERQVVVKLLFCGMQLPGFVEKNR